jgi:hypothetical protein
MSDETQAAMLASQNLRRVNDKMINGSSALPSISVLGLRDEQLIAVVEVLTGMLYGAVLKEAAEKGVTPEQFLDVLDQSLAAREAGNN